ncbi:MAG: hypothetical protein IPO66_22920 [Rhodanobacteraceae bacterium]|nr:hypothetical protein [Rhodanobacteraceae bacterium]
MREALLADHRSELLPTTSRRPARPARAEGKTAAGQPQETISCQIHVADDDALANAAEFMLHGQQQQPAKITTRTSTSRLRRRSPDRRDGPHRRGRAGRAMFGSASAIGELPQAGVTNCMAEGYQSGHGCAG